MEAAFVAPVVASSVSAKNAVATPGVTVCSQTKAAALSFARSQGVFGSQITARNAQVLQSHPAFECVAQMKPEELIKAASAGFASLATMAASAPVFAADLIDAGMLTEGTGKPLGINDSTLTFVLLGVFAVIFVFYLTWARDQPDVE
eukprot:EC121712.1.p1 GENE.EC121712.1~~EC121712.1.p1  ORF type:complete len:147 (+),score=36.50 EC121712.1:73-513(+)